MRKRFVALVAAMMLTLTLAGTALAAQPLNPGCFGEIRSFNLGFYYLSGGPFDVSPGASEWGEAASSRGSTNGENNQDFRTFCGGHPL